MGPAEVPGVPCLALRAAGLFVLARRERRGFADTGAPERGETRGKHLGQPCFATSFLRRLLFLQ